MDDLKKSMKAEMEATKCSLDEARKEQIETVKDVSSRPLIGVCCLSIFLTHRTRDEQSLGDHRINVRSLESAVTHIVVGVSAS